MNILGIDPRANSEEKIEPPFPMPFVSRRALKRVKDRLEAPEQCPYCRGEVKLTSNEEVYGREYGEWPYLYMCQECIAYVGVHPKTDIPLGTLADASTREARKQAKDAFQQVTGTHFKGDRNKAYQWLAKHMKIDPRTCHFAMFDKARCAVAVKTIMEKL